MNTFVLTAPYAIGNVEEVCEFTTAYTPLQFMIITTGGVVITLITVIVYVSTSMESARNSSTSLGSAKPSNQFAR